MTSLNKIQRSRIQKPQDKSATKSKIVNQIDNWSNSPRTMACLICAAFFAMGAGWLATLAGSFDFIREGHIGLGIFSAITCLVGLIAFLFGLSVVNRTLIFTHFTESTYHKTETNEKNKDSNPYRNPMCTNCPGGSACPDDSTNHHEDYPETKKHKYLSHLAGVYRLLGRLSTKTR